jgi:hypothetical protein
LIALQANDSYSLQPNLSLVRGKHSMKLGVEFRRYNDNSNNPGFASGQYTFGRNWTQQNALQADALSGNEFATFLLGIPTSGFVDRNIDPAYRNYYYSAFYQDDWKVTPRFTVNLGLRWDYEAPAVERYDRQLRGFDFNGANPLATRVPGLKGTVQFAGVNGQPRSAFNPDKNNWQPRIGAAYRLGQKWVVRAGYGLYYLGQNEFGAAQGFSQRTAVTPSTDGGLTPAVNLANPFSNLPGGRLLAPIGSSLGPASFIGEGITVNYLDRPLPYSHQYSFDIERELPHNMLVEAAYVGNQTRRLPVGLAANVLPAGDLDRRTAAGAIDQAYYNERLPNPMEGLIPNNASLNGATIPRQLLLLPYREFGGITLNNVPIGRQRYDGFQAKVTKRFSGGFTFLASYGIGKTLEQVSLLNNQDFILSDPQSSPLDKRPANQIDIPQKFTIVGVYELPVGRGKPFGGNLVKPVDLLIGGWQLSWDVTYQKGWAIDYPNAAQVRPGSAKLSSPNIDHWFDTSLWVDPASGRNVPAQPAFTLRNFPTRFSDVRFPGYQNWDASVSKYFSIHEQIRMQFRFEMINALNHPWYTALISGGNDVTSPNFGRLNFVQRNLPRFIKLGLTLNW